MSDNQAFMLPEGLELVGVYKFKDKEGKQAIRIKISGDVRELVVQKVRGESNKMVVAVRRGDYEYGSIITPESSLVGTDGKKL